MARTRKPSTEEVKLWRLAMRDVAPLKPAEETPSLPESEPPAKSGGKPAGRPAVAPSASTGGTRLPPIHPDRSPGVEGRPADRRRRGRLPIAGRPDLPGMTQAEAHAALTGFVLGGYENGRRSGRARGRW